MLLSLFRESLLYTELFQVFPYLSGKTNAGQNRYQINRKSRVKKQLDLRIRRRKRRRRNQEQDRFLNQPSPDVLDRDPFACVLSGFHSLPCCGTPALGGIGVEKLRTGLAYVASLPK